MLRKPEADGTVGCGNLVSDEVVEIAGWKKSR
jgi:hypothetical protein